MPYRAGSDRHLAAQHLALNDSQQAQMVALPKAWEQTNPHWAQIVFICRAMDVPDVLYKSPVMQVERRADSQAPRARQPAFAAGQSGRRIQAGPHGGARQRAGARK